MQDAVWALSRIDHSHTEAWRRSSVDFASSKGDLDQCAGVEATDATGQVD
jgi:hypothetical protein